MGKLFVSLIVLVCLVIANNVDWSVGAIDTNTLAPNLLDLGKLNGSQSTLEDGQQFLREKCQKNSKLNDSYDMVLEAKYNFENCVKSLVDITVLKNELIEAKPTGDVDSVFHKYCKKTPIFMGCLQNFSSVMDECMDKDEKKTKQVILNITQSVLNFLCFDEGDRLALFYAEGGPDCFMNNKEGIKRCINTTFSQYMPIGMPNDLINSSIIPEFSFQEDQCKSISKVQVCLVKELENCNDLTPSNLIDSLFNFVRKSSPCSKFKKT